MFQFCLNGSHVSGEHVKSFNNVDSCIGIKKLFEYILFTSWTNVMKGVCIMTSGIILSRVHAHTFH